MPDVQGVDIWTKGLGCPRCRVCIPLLHKLDIIPPYVVKGNCKGGIFMSKNQNETSNNIWTSSLAEFKNIKVIATCGILMALGVALKYVASIDIGNYIRIGFSNIPNIVASYLFGPAIGCFFWGALDIIKYLIAPNGAFFPGFTISAAINGIIFGCILYKKPLSIYRVLVAQVISKVFVNICLNTLWLNILYQQAIKAILPARILSNAIMLPIDTIITFVFLRIVVQIWRQAERNV